MDVVQIARFFQHSKRLAKKRRNLRKFPWRILFLLLLSMGFGILLVATSSSLFPNSKKIIQQPDTKPTDTQTEPLVTTQPTINDVLFTSLSHLPSVKEEEERRQWGPQESMGWQPAANHRAANWSMPQSPSNGILMVRCNGGLNQQRSAICNAVVVARLMNATLLLPKLDANPYWNDESGFEDIYDADRFISSLKADVEIIRHLPSGYQRISKHQMNPPREVGMDWYTTVGVKALKRHKLLYLTPFAHRLAEELGNSSMAQELQRLRCRVNYEALKFHPTIEMVADSIHRKLRQNGPYVAMHLRFEMDMLAFAGCVDIFSSSEQEQLIRYRKENFAEKKLIPSERRKKGKCPLTPEEAGIILKALRYPNTTRVYLAVGEVFGGERFLAPLREMFPNVMNRTSVASEKELALVTHEGRGLLGPAVDYLVCLKADMFMPNYDGPSNFANNVMGHRRFLGFKTSVQPYRRNIIPLLEILKNGSASEDKVHLAIRNVIYQGYLGNPRPRDFHESFFTNPWPECFLQVLNNGRLF